jgi:hypothetical protein
MERPLRQGGEARERLRLGSPAAEQRPREAHARRAKGRRLAVEVTEQRLEVQQHPLDRRGPRGERLNQAEARRRSRIAADSEWR